MRHVALNSILAAATVAAVASSTSAHRLLVGSANRIEIYSAERTPPTGNPPPIPGTPRWEHTYLGQFATLPNNGNARRMVWGPDGNLYVASAPSVISGDAILRFDAAGNPLGEFIHGEPFLGLAFGPDGNLYVSQLYGGSASGQIVVFDGATGAFLRRFDPPGNGLMFPGDLAFLPNGDLLVANQDGVRRYQGGTGYYMGYLVGGGGEDITMTVDFAGDRIYLGGDYALQVAAVDLDGHEIWSNHLTQNGSPGFVFQIPQGFLYAGALYAGPDCLDRDTGTYLGGPYSFPSGACIAMYRGDPSDAVTPQAHHPTLNVASPADRLRLTYSIDRPGTSRLLVYDARGRVVHRVELRAAPHSQSYEWNPGERETTRGVYFVELKTSNGRQTAKWVRAR